MRVLIARLDDLERGPCGPEIRTGIELLMDTGRRPAEIALPLDCLARDADGGPVLIYHNHKGARNGRRLPVTEATAEVISGERANASPLAEVRTFGGHTEALRRKRAARKERKQRERRDAQKQADVIRKGRERPDNEFLGLGVVVRDPEVLDGAQPNARDFRCFRLFGVLWSSCPVSVLVPVFLVALAVSGHGGCPRVAAGLARGSTVRVPRRAGGSSFLTGCFPGGG